MKGTHASRLVLAVLAMAVLLPAIAGAQGETGTIAGTVKDATGGVLPGVTVEAASPALIEKARSITTDADGRYQITSLRPGLYTVTFELPGFSTIVREGISLAAGFTASVNVELRVGAIEEIVTVSGAAPTVDVKNVVQQKTMSRDIIDSLPSAKTFGSLAVLIPGVTVSRPDVGGASGDLSTSLTVHGSRTSDSQIMMDGMSVGNGLGAGSYGHFFNNGMLEEISVETGGMAAEHDVAGVRSNLIPREGGNSFRGIVFGNYTNQHFNSSGVSPELSALGLQTNSVDRIYDFNPSGGGRLKHDKLWFFLSYREWGTRTTRAGASAAFPNTDSSALVYAPDLSQRAYDHTWHRSASNRFTWQASSRNKVAALYEFQDHEYEFANDSVGSAPEVRSFYRETPQYLAQVTWSSPLNNRFLVEAGGSLAANDFIRLPQPEVVPGIAPITELSTNFSYRANPTAPYGHNRSSNYNYRASASYVTGSHALKTGVFLQHTWSWSTTEPNSPLSLSVRNGVPVSLVQWGTPISYYEKIKYNIGLFVQDRWTFSRATVNLGVRADFFNAFVEPQSLPAGIFVPARDFPGVYDIPKWQDVSPRLGVSYDVFGNGRTAVKANLGGFPLAAGIPGFTRLANPMSTTVNSVSRTWNDTNGNFVPDCNLTSQSANEECGQMQNVNFGNSVVSTRYANDVSKGFGVRGYNWEGAASVQHEFATGVSVNASYNRRWYSNFTVTQNLLVSNADFSPFCITVPSDPRLPEGGGNQLCGFYDVNPAKFGQSDNLISQASPFGKLEEVYDGIDLSGTVRLAGDMLLSGGVGIGRTRINNCGIADDLSLAYAGSATGVAASRTTPFCDVRPPLQPNVKFLGVYPLPVWGLQVSATVQSTPGPEITASYAAINAEIRTSLGRDLSAGQNATVLVDLIPKGTLYGDRINQLDLRLAKLFKIGSARIQGMFDLYNAFNATPFLTVQNRFGPAWQTPTQTLIGRLAKFAAQIDF
jgi:carboxypeptidase family protein/TonB-dependent receptor-like protein